MDKSGKFLLPSPKFLKLEKTAAPSPHFLSPQGMLLPKEKQPPPMYGPRGSTVPPKFLDRQNSPDSRNQVERTPKFYCDPCEAEFHTSTDFKVHRSEHVGCEIDNCSFRGHPSFMDTHIGLQHATGIYNELKKLSTPEEIAQWRAERKKNYPTVAIVQQKEKAREQRMLRGEKLEEKRNRFGKRDDRRQMGTNQKGEGGETVVKKNSWRKERKRNRSGKPIAEKKEKKENVVDVEAVKNEGIVAPAVCGGLKMFTGTGGMADYKKVRKVESHALTGLLGMYGSASESEDEEENIEKDELTEAKDEPKSEISLKESIDDGSSDVSSHETPTTQGNLKMDDVQEDPSSSVNEDAKPTAITQSEVVEAAVDTCDPSATHDSADEAPEEVSIAKSSNIPDKPQPTAPPKKQKKLPPKRPVRQFGLNYKKLRVGRQNTLLEKLLEPDIRHERNVLLQCVRFVVENNFFGIGSSTTQSKS